MEKLEAVLLTQLGKTLDEFFLQTVKLIAAFRQIACIDLIFKPDPLEKRRFI